MNDPTVTCASVIPRDCVGMFGEDPDPALGALWYRLAAEQGLAEAQNNLGTLVRRRSWRSPGQYPSVRLV